MEEKRETALKKGYLVKSPPTEKAGSSVKKWKLRWFVLSEVTVNNPSDIIEEYRLLLSYYEDNKSEKEGKLPKGFINVLDCTDILLRTAPLSGFDHIFDIKCPTRTYHLSADSCMERNNWLSLLRRYRFGETDVIPSDHLYISQGSLKGNALDEYDRLARKVTPGCLANDSRRNTSCYEPSNDDLSPSSRRKSVQSETPLLVSSEEFPRRPSAKSTKSDTAMLRMRTDGLVTSYKNRSSSYSADTDSLSTGYYSADSSTFVNHYDTIPADAPVLPPRPPSMVSMSSEGSLSGSLSPTSPTPPPLSPTPPPLEDVITVFSPPDVNSNRTFSICEKCQSSVNKTDRKSGKIKSVKRRFSDKLKRSFPSFRDDSSQDLPFNDEEKTQKTCTDDPYYVDMTYASKVLNKSETAASETVVSEDQSRNDSASEEDSTASTPKLEKRGESCIEHINEAWVSDIRQRLESMNVARSRIDEDIYVDMHNPEQKDELKRSEPMYANILGDMPADTDNENRGEGNMKVIDENIGVELSSEENVEADSAGNTRILSRNGTEIVITNL